MTSFKYSTVKHFPLTDELRALKIQKFAKIGPILKVEYDGKPIRVVYRPHDLIGMLSEFGDEADKVIVSNGIPKSEIMGKLTRHMTNVLLEDYEKGRANEDNNNNNNGDTSSRTTKGQQQKQQQQHQQHQSETATVMKYTVQEEEEQKHHPQLWETVKVGSKFYLVSYDTLKRKLSWTESIEESESRTLKPNTENGIEHYSFRDAGELEEYIELARLHTIGSLFKKVKHCVSSFYDTDTEEYVNLVSADIIFTQFQDKIGKTHYIFVFGEPGTGKGAILECFNQLGYRGVAVTDATAASIYRVLGNVEKGQVIMIIDEANKLEDNSFLLDILKVGYKGDAKVPRVMDASSGEHSKVVYYYAYCFKIIAAEKLPAGWKTGGFLSRCFIIHSSPGDPAYDIGDIIENAGDPENARIMHEIEKLRKLLFAYRLLHYSDPIPDIKIKGISGRDRELIKPLLRLFKAHGADKEVFETIKKTLHYFVMQRNQEKTDSFEATVHQYVRKLMTCYNTKELTFIQVWDYLKEQLGGQQPVEGKPDTMETSLFGEISKKRLAGILKNFGGKRDRNSTGDKRIWIFDNKTLDRFGKVYTSIPATIEIVERQETLESSLFGGESKHATFRLFDDNDDDGDEETEEEQPKQSSDTSDTSDTSLQDNSELGNDSTPENRTETAANNKEITTNRPENIDNLDNKNSSDGQAFSKEASEVSEVSESDRDAITNDYEN